MTTERQEQALLELAQLSQELGLDKITTNPLVRRNRVNHGFYVFVYKGYLLGVSVDQAGFCVTPDRKCNVWGYADGPESEGWRGVDFLWWCSGPYEMKKVVEQCVAGASPTPPGSTIVLYTRSEESKQ